MLDLFRYLLEKFSGTLEVRSEKNQVNQPVTPPKKAVFGTALFGIIFSLPSTIL